MAQKRGMLEGMTLRRVVRQAAGWANWPHMMAGVLS